MKTLTIITLGLVMAVSAWAAGTPDQQQDHGRRSKSFQVKEGGTLDVSVNGGDIRITTGSKDEVVVTVDDLNDEEAYSEVKMTQDGNTVRISDRGGWSTGGRYSVKLPSRFNLHLETSIGDIVVRGKLTGNIDGETSAGNIRMDDVDGAVEVRTSGGDIQAGKISGKANLSTSGGDIEVASSSNDLDMRTSGGELRVGNVGKSLRARTAGGDIIIGDVGGEADASTAGGNVRVGKVSGRVSLNTAGGDIELNGGSGKIKASTSGGNIALMNIAGSVDAQTSGGDIHAELTPAGKGSTRLSSSGGIIVLAIPENAHATIAARIRVQGGWRSRKEDYSIRSDFKPESSSRDDGEREIRSRFVLNGGGETITLETSNSDIEIKKLKK
jgi:DUF4097 and DUF4098 domain-containing protein YvlB